ncbi:MAG: hypothetical protein ACJ71M_09305 [Nitrososphaeraceae archaeon]
MSYTIDENIAEQVENTIDLVYISGNYQIREAAEMAEQPAASAYQS